MILVGDIIKQTKKINGFDCVGKEFEVTGVDGTNIAFKSDMGIGVMTINELNMYFEKVIKTPQWSEWIIDPNNYLYYYRVKGNVIQYKDLNGMHKVQSKCMACDEFNLETGLEICRLKMTLAQF